MARAGSLFQNELLSGLPTVDFARLQDRLELVPLVLGASIYEAGAGRGHAYFPLAGIISLLQVMESGESVEIAVVGNEGVVGIAMLMGGEAAESRAVVQSAGHAQRLPADCLATEFGRGGRLQQALLRYAQAVITQMSQTAVCTRDHSVEQQFCRWLLMSLDRLPSNEMVMTEGLIANMLGVDPEGVSAAIRRLQERQLIKYSRGRMAVLDRPKLEACACECYGVVAKEYDRLLAAPLQ